MRLNLAARAGRWSAAHWKTATFGWLAFVIAAFVIGGAVGTKTLGDTDGLPGESGRMAKILDEDFKTPAGETVLVQSDTLDATSPEFRSTVDGRGRARSRPCRSSPTCESPLEPANGDQISPDGSSAIVTFDIRGDPSTAADRVDPVVAAVDEVKAAHPELYVGNFGAGTAEKEIDGAVGDDLERAGLLSLPVTIAILIVAFGALVAAGIPLLLALTAVIATMGLLAIPSQVWPVDGDNTSAVVLLIGLAVGVDYALFYLKREREERAAGRSETAALEAAAATSGRAVLVSGLTVMASMAGMFLTRDEVFSSFAMATIMVVAIAVLGSLTVLPALLSRLGDNVNKARIPLLHRLQRPGAAAGGAGSSTASCAAAPLGSRVGRDPGRARLARARDEDGRARRGGVPAGPASRPDVQPAPGLVPRRAAARVRRRQGALDRRSARERRDRRAPRAGSSRAARPTSR